MPLVEASDTMRGWSANAGEARSASLIRSCAAMFTAMTESHVSGFMFASSLSRVIPALWTTMSIPP